MSPRGARWPGAAPLAKPTGDALSELAARASRGDRLAFAELVEKTTPAVYGLALRLVNNEHDARDVVQETYLRAFRSIGRFRGEAAVTSWLWRICANCASTHLRRGRQLLAELDEEMPLVEWRGEANPEAALEALGERAELVEQLALLPAALRVVIVLRDIYDLPHEVIAKELGISRAAAKVRLHRARRQLRELLYPPLGEARRRSRPAAAVESAGREEGRAVAL